MTRVSEKERRATYDLENAVEMLWEEGATSEQIVERVKDHLRCIAEEDDR